MNRDLNRNDNSKKPLVYSAMEVARFCGVVNQTAINWIKNKYIKAFQTPGGQYRVYPEDLVDFMKKKNIHIPVELLQACHKSDGKNILLLVDDDRVWNDVMAKYLSSKLEETVIIQAFDGFEAGALMVKKRPNLVVLDLDLPGIDGIRICKTISEENSFGKPSIIVTTALEDDGLEKRCLELGVSKFLRKPVNLPALAEDLVELY
ncbi:MAG: response regulator [Treponema sp.]|nr:response regulator [Treponema sp.]